MMKNAGTTVMIKTDEEEISILRGNEKKSKERDLRRESVRLYFWYVSFKGI